MSWLVVTCMRFRRLVVAAAVGLLVLAWVQLRDAPRAVYPDLLPPTVQIQTEALGLSAAEVEQLVTVPLEQDLLNGVPWLDHITSRSMPGLSAIDLVFEPDTDVYAARQMVQERLTQAHALPNVGSPPIMVQPLASAGRVAMVGLTSSSVSLVDMSVLARWKIRPKLMGVPGVANVSIYGQRDRQLQVEVDPARLRAADVTLTDVIQTAGNALWVSPLSFVEASTPGTGGFVESPNQRLAVQHLLPISTPEQLARVPVENAPKGTLLGDVATVVEDHQPLIGDALVSSSPSLYLVVDRFPGTDPGQVERRVEQAMADLTPGLKGITVDTSVYRPASYLDSALRTLGLAGLLGLLLMLGALLLTQSSWRAAAVVMSVTVLSLTVATYVLALLGVTLTTMTLLGLCAALALVVDDAVRSVEAVRTELLAGEGPLRPRLHTSTVAAACIRERRMLLFSVAIALVATVPFLVMDRLSTAFTRPAVAAYATALLASTLVALVVAPTAALLLLRATPAGLRQGPVSRVLLQVWDRRAQRPRSPRLAWAVVGVLAVASLAVLPQWGSRSLLPHLQDRSLLVHLATAPGTSVAEMDRVAGLVAEEVRQVPHVGDVGAHVGRAITSDQQVDVNEAELWLTLDDDADYAKTTAAVERVVTSYPGVRGSLVTYPEDTVAAAVDPDRDNLVVRVYGIDQTELATQAKRVLNKIRNVRGVVSPTVRTVPVQPAVHVQVDLARAAQYGLRPGDVRRDTTTLTSGLIVGSLYEEAKVFDVVVWGGPAARHSITDLENLRIDVGGSGRQVRLGDVASVTVASDPVVIEHHETSRSVDVVAQVSGRSPAAVAADVRAAVATLDNIPYEYHAEVLSGPERVWSDTVRTGLVAVAAVLFVLLLAQAATRSWRRSALLVALLPLSLAGAVLAGALTGGIHQVGALAALLGALVLTARQGLVVARTGDARSQLVPVVTTALATAALVLPAAVLGDRPGLESVQPFAVTLLGGLVSSTLVVLVVLPAFLPTPAPVAVEAAAAEAAEKERVVDITDPTTTTTEGSTP